MKDWQNIISEEVGREHRDQVLTAASSILKENQVRAGSEMGRRFFFGKLVGGFAAAAVAVFVVFRPSQRIKEQTSSDFLAMMPLVELDLDMLADIDVIEDLEVLEKWEPKA